MRHRRTMRMLAAALVVVLGGLICMTGCALTPLAGPPESTQSHRVRATPTGLALDGKPWWPVGFNAYQLGTDWSVNTGCGAEVDLDDYFAQLPPRALTRFNLYSSFVVDKRSGLMDFGPLDRVFAAASRHRQLVLPVLTGGSGDCEDGRFKDRGFYVNGWRTQKSRSHQTYAEWVQTAVTRWHDEPSIIGWELVGEPEASSCGTACDWRNRVCPDDATAVLRGFFDQAGAHLRSFDDARPIFSGLVGGDQCGIAGDAYAEVAGSSGIDVLDFHDYSSGTHSGPRGSNLPTRITQSRQLGKPLVVNEIGVEAGSCLPLSTRARQLDAIITRQRDAGTAGALLWSYVPDPRTSECTYDIGPHDPAWKVVRDHAR